VTFATMRDTRKSPTSSPSAGGLLSTIGSNRDLDVQEGMAVTATAPRGNWLTE